MQRFIQCLRSDITISVLLSALVLPVALPLSVQAKAPPTSALSGVYAAKGRAYSGQKKYREASIWYGKAIALAPRNTRYLMLRAAVHNELGEHSKAIDDLSTTLKVNPALAEAYQRRAELYLNLGKLHKALLDCNSAIKLKPLSLDSYSTAAEANKRLCFYDEAIKALSKAIALKSDLPFDWSNRAHLYELTNQFALARNDRARAFAMACPHQKLALRLGSPLADFANISGKVTAHAVDTAVMPLVLPFRYDCGSHMAVPVVVNDHPVRFMLDTGADTSALFQRAIPAVASLGKVRVPSVKSNGQEDTVGFVNASSLKLANLSLSNVPLEVRDDKSHKTMSGHLGGNLLENFAVTIDYSSKQIILSRKFAGTISDRAVVVPIWQAGHQPICQIKLDDKVEVAALLDTGCPHSLCADALLGPLCPKRLRFNKSINGIWLDNLHVGMVKLTSMQMGNKRFNVPVLNVFPASEAPLAAYHMTLGNDFLSRFKTVTFDYPARRMVFEPTDIDSDSVAALMREARYQTNNDNVLEAIKTYEAVMKLDQSRKAECFYYRGNLLLHLNKVPEAITDFSDSLALKPNSRWPLYFRAHAYSALGQYQNCVADATRVIKIDPNLVDIYLCRAKAYKMLGKYALAQNDRDTAKKLSIKSLSTK
jgi:tetratricopeptide (TPR) repeat protein